MKLIQSYTTGDKPKSRLGFFFDTSRRTYVVFRRGIQRGISSINHYPVKKGTTWDWFICG